MAERHGIERLRWLESESNMAMGHGSYPPLPLTQLQVLNDREVMVEVAYALIEELHSALVGLGLHGVYDETTERWTWKPRERG